MQVDASVYQFHHQVIHVAINVVDVCLHVNGMCLTTDWIKKSF
jgi:hypothetical protein